MCKAHTMECISIQNPLVFFLIRYHFPWLSWCQMPVADLRERLSKIGLMYTYLHLCHL